MSPRAFERALSAHTALVEKPYATVSRRYVEDEPTTSIDLIRETVGTGLDRARSRSPHRLDGQEDSLETSSCGNGAQDTYDQQ